ncbi:MAG: hypothetical protein HC859_01885 [Bacteroidia bacterium]|nr:hypothetical protein [Bacteroidia bacterium]
MGSIYLMMNKHFIKLMIAGVVLATPLVWWLIQQWLDTFENRIEISPWVFVIAGSVQVLLALVCVAYLSLRAASLNPSAVLKEE